MAETVAFVGAAGGVGTTTLTLECGRLLAREGVDTAILDTAYGTQGLSDRISGRLAPDVTRLCLEELPLEEGLIDLPIEGAGRLAACPAHAPFERLARAKRSDAAERFERLLEEASRHFECVLVDVPPVATNPAVAAVSVAETVAVVADDSRAEAVVPRTEDRLADVGVDSSTTVVTRTDAHPDADVAIPPVEADPFEAGPNPDPDSGFVDGLAELVASTTTVSVDRSGSGGLLESVPFR
jgi:septum site-determining protein MinD